MNRIAIDSSAIVAQLFEEEDWEKYHILLAESEVLISTATWVEIGRFMTVRLGPAGLLQLHTFRDGFGVTLVPVDEQQAEIAVQGALAYGKGRGREPAVLNFGDLFSYALAKAMNLPLLFKGADFASTDVRSALAELS